MDKKGFLCSKKGNTVAINFASIDGKRAVIVGGRNKVVPAILTDPILEAQENGRIKIFESKEKAEAFVTPKKKAKSGKKKAGKKKSDEDKKTASAPSTPPAKPATGSTPPGKGEPTVSGSAKPPATPGTGTKPSEGSSPGNKSYIKDKLSTFY